MVRQEEKETNLVIPPTTNQAWEDAYRAKRGEPRRYPQPTTPQQSSGEIQEEAYRKRRAKQGSIS